MKLISSTQHIHLFGRSLPEIGIVVMAVIGFGAAVGDHFAHNVTLTWIDGVRILGAAALTGGSNVMAFLFGQYQGSKNGSVRLSPELIERFSELSDDQLARIVGGAGVEQIREACSHTEHKEQ